MRGGQCAPYRINRACAVGGAHPTKPGRAWWPTLLFGRHKVLESLAAADDAVCASFDQYLSGPRTVVVVAAHREAVGARGEHREQITSLCPRQGARVGEKIAALADGADNFDDFTIFWLQVLGAASWNIRRIRPRRPDEVVGTIERRTDQVVHGRIDDHNLLFTTGLAIENAREKHGSIAGDVATRFEGDVIWLVADERKQGFGMLGDGQRLIGPLVVDGKATTQVKPLNLVPAFHQTFDQA